MRRRRTRRNIIAPIAALILMGAGTADDDHPATCEGFLGSIELSARTGDPLSPQAYLDLADKMFGVINKAGAARGLAPLSVPNDPMLQAERGMAIAAECKSNMSLKFREALVQAYMKMRHAAGLPLGKP